MPEISLFYGIRITMDWNDHNPPHFHAQYGNNKAVVLIEDGVISEGYLPSRQLKFVLAWTEIHKDELMQNCIQKFTRQWQEKTIQSMPI